MSEAVEARGRLGRGWPLVALVAGVLGVVLGLLIGWLV
jgi:tetrahydromethanopterin S-methyltransferase subunit D